MFFKKTQIIKFDTRICQLLPDDSEPIYIKICPIIKDFKAQLEIPVNYRAFFLKGGNFGEPIITSPVNIFSDKSEAKDFKKGHSLEIVFVRNEQSLIANWFVSGDSSTIFKDKTSKQTIFFRSASGTFSVSIENIELFYKKVISYDKDIYRLDDLERYAFATIKSAFIDCFFNVIENENIDFTSLVRYRAEISRLICEAVNKEIFNEGFQFKYIKIDTLNLEYSETKDRLFDNGNRNFKSDDALTNENITDVPDKNSSHSFKLENNNTDSSFNFQNDVHFDTTIKSIVCKSCGHENPTNVDYCVFCYSKLNKED